MTKQEQIKEMKQIICERSEDGICLIDKTSCDSICGWTMQAKAIYDAGYRKVNKDNIILTKEEYIDLSRTYVKEQKEQMRKETAKEILDSIFAPYNEIGDGLYELTPKDKKMLYKKYEVETENDELKKQVDKAKEQFLLTCENCHFKKDIELLQYQKEQAVQEFAEKLKEKYGHYWCYLWKKDLKQLRTIIDELLKEYEK